MIELEERRRPAVKSSVTVRTAVALVLSLVMVSCGSSEETGAPSSPDPNLLKEGKLKVCTSLPYVPFEFKRDGKPVGFDIDLVNEVAKTLKVKPVIVNADFDAIKSGQVLNNGKCDVAVAALSINGERARVLDFSSPYFDAAQAMVVREDSDIDSLDDLSGGRIGVQGGTTGELYVTDNAPGDAEIVPLETAGDIDAALDRGDVDAGVYDSTVVDDVVARFPDFEAVEQFDTSEQYGMAVKKNSNVDLLRIINEVLARLQAGKGYDAIYKKWFGEAPRDQ